VVLIQVTQQLELRSLAPSCQIPPETPIKANAVPMSGYDEGQVQWMSAVRHLYRTPEFCQSMYRDAHYSPERAQLTV
jgi:hypothetical protein